MKIRVRDKSYGEVMALPVPPHALPGRQRAFFRLVMRLISIPELRATNFRCVRPDAAKLSRKEPALILMNHSSFTDLNITSKLYAGRSYHIVCTRDGFVGKNLLMRALGCIPTDKFVTDISLIRDIRYCLEKQKSSVILFPEASYSFDGSETPLPESLGKLVKLLRVPVLMVKTDGAFLRDPLYNGLRKRKVSVSAKETLLFSREDAETLSVNEINERLRRAFSYDHFRAQYASGVKVCEEFRAEGLNRVLYKCPRCLSEGTLSGKGSGISCGSCGSRWELKEDGTLREERKPGPDGLSGPKPERKAAGGDAFRFVTDWYAWEREEVRKEILSGKYRMSEDVDICILRDTKSLYRVGEGTLVHDLSGFTLDGCRGLLHYHQTPAASYSLYADYYWYEIGDMISIGDTKRQFYCFPKDQAGCIVAKARLAAEELYRLRRK